MPQFSVGDVLVGGRDRYEITRLISDKGGYGVTYEVKDSLGNRRVAKVRREASDFPTVQDFQVCARTFEVEANALASFNHPQIPEFAEIFDFQGKRVMIMAFVEGRDLKDIMDERENQGNPITPDEAVEWLIDLLGILEYIHNPPFVVTHRDQKLENIMLNRAGKVVILDFGGSTQPKLGQYRRTSIISATRAFASPQVWEGTTPSEPRDDIFSVGMMLEELLTGDLPAELSNPDGKTIAVSTPTGIVRGATPKINPGDINNKIVQRHPQCAYAQGLEDIIFKARRFERDDRYQSAAEMRQALEQLIAGAPEIRLSATAHNFGQVPVGRSKSWPFEIRNSGTKPLNLKSITASQTCYKPSYSGQVVGASGSLRVDVEFTPVDDALVRGIIEIKSDDPNNPTVRVTLEGEGTLAKIELMPTTLDFGQVKLGWKAERRLKAKNTGKAALEVIAMTVPNFFKVNVQAPFTLAANGGEREVTVECVPERTGSLRAPLLFETNIPGSQFVDVELIVQATVAQKPELTFVTPSSVEQGASGVKVTLYGQNFPLEQFLLIDFGPGVSVPKANIKTISRTNVELSVDVAADAPTTSRKVVVLNQLGGLAPAELADSFTVTKAKIRPIVASINPTQFYPGDRKAITIMGSGFVKDFKYKTTKRLVGGGRGAQIVDVEDPETRHVLLPSISTNAPGATFNKVEWVSPTLLKAELSISLPADDPTGKSYPAGNYNIIVSNPDGQTAIGQGLLQIQTLPTDQKRCPHCQKLTDATKKFCQHQDCRRLLASRFIDKPG